MTQPLSRFNTLEQTELLKESGMDENPARAVVRAIQLAHDDQTEQVNSLVSKEHLQAEMSELRVELGTQMSGLETQMANQRAELKTEMSDLRLELKTEMSGLRVELKTEMAEVRVEMADLKAEVQTQAAGLETQIAKLGTQMTGLKAELFRMMWLQGGAIILIMMTAMTALKVF